MYFPIILKGDYMSMCTYACFCCPQLATKISKNRFTKVYISVSVLKKKKDSSPSCCIKVTAWNRSPNINIDLQTGHALTVTILSEASEEENRAISH